MAFGITTLSQDQDLAGLCSFSSRNNGGYFLTYLCFNCVAGCGAHRSLYVSVETLSSDNMFFGGNFESMTSIRNIGEETVELMCRRYLLVRRQLLKVGRGECSRQKLT